MHPDRDAPTQLELFSSGPFTLRLPVGGALTIFFELYWKHTAKSKTTAKVFKRIAAFFADRYVDEISKSDIEAFRRHLIAIGLRGNTVNTHHVVLSRMFTKLSEWKEARSFGGTDFSNITLPARNPAALVPKVNEALFRRGVAWPKTLVYRIINAAVRMNDLDLAEIVEMLYLTRLRPGDLWRMSDRNVNIPRMVLAGIQNKTVTSRNPSGVPYLIAISERMKRVLVRRIEKTAPGLPLFRPSNLQKRFNAVRVLANAKQVQLRDFRPSAATLLLDNNIDPRTVSDSLGQTTLRMLPAYTPRKIVHLRKAQEVLEKKETEIIR
jgi:integrase